MSTMLRCISAVLSFFCWMENAKAFSAYPTSVHGWVRSRTSTAAGSLSVFTIREADPYEQLYGGERYEMSQLPDSMMATTIFVGNLCEFVSDDDLSDLFRSVSSLQSVPACVVRKPDMSSRQFGFVSFLTQEEKDAAILRFHNYEWRGKSLKVEPIKDHPTAGRVKLPEKMVAYVSGVEKKVSRKSRNNDREFNSLRRISRDDVERLSRGQPSKKRGYGSRNVPHRLTDKESAELQRAQRKGFVSLAGGRYLTAKSALSNIHRQWCDARAKPQIILYKGLANGSGARQPMDKIVVDLSPLRLYASSDTAKMESAMCRFLDEIETAAMTSGMEQCRGEKDDPDECSLFKEEVDDEYEDEEVIFSVDLVTQEAWATKPIWQLPVLCMNEFVGERQQAKAMAKELALLWDVPEAVDGDDFGPRNRPKNRRKKQHRRRGGGHRQAFY